MGSGTSSEAALVEAARQGDDTAFQTLFARHERTLRRYARRWLPPRMRRRVSESDLLQETQLVALRRVTEFEHRHDGGFRNWLLKILQNKVRECVQLHAAAKKRDVGLEVTRPDTTQFRASTASPSEAAAVSELAEIAAEAMKRLPPSYREVLTLRQGQQLTLREIAECTDSTREAVKKTYGRAMARFKLDFDRLRGERS